MLTLVFMGYLINKPICWP